MDGIAVGSSSSSKLEQGQDIRLELEKQEDQSPIDTFAQWKPSFAEWWMIASFMIVSLVVALDATILVPILPTIAESLHGTANDTFWVGTSYLLTCAAFQPFIVALSDVFGRKQGLLGSVLFFTLGTLICCLSQNFTQLLVGRSIQGIGGGGVTALPNVIFTDFVPLRQRPTYNALNQMSWAVGTITGPLIGGLLTDHKNWRWVFYINFPFCAIGIVMVPIVVRLKVDRPSLKERLLYIDWLGGLLFIGSTFSFLFGITSGGTKYAWKDWRTILSMTTGIAGILATILWERSTSRPFLRLSIFNSRSACAAYNTAILQGTLMFCELYYIPQFLETAKNLSATLAGVGMVAITCAVVPVSVVVGALITRLGRFRWAIWSGWALTILATGLLILLDQGTKTAVWVVLFVLVGLGHGLVLMSLNFCIQALADTRDVAYAAAMYTFLRTFWMCIGVAIGGTVFQNRLVNHLAVLNFPVDVAANAEAFIAVLKSLPIESPRRAAFTLAYSLSFRNVFEVLAGIAALGGILSLFIGHASMDRPLDSEHTTRGNTNKKRDTEDITTTMYKWLLI